MEYNTVISNVGDAVEFAVIGFTIVMSVLLIVTLSLMLIMKLESVFFPDKTEQEQKDKKVRENEAAVDPVVIAIITAAVMTQFKVQSIKRIRRISSAHHSSSWSESGRMAHHTSHTFR